MLLTSIIVLQGLFEPVRDEVLGKWKHTQMRRIAVYSLQIFLLWLCKSI
jgi:hypothetical protein